jgi:hypothetical protein
VRACSWQRITWSIVHGWEGTADNFRETYEGIDRDPMQDNTGLVVYIRERSTQAWNGTVLLPAYDDHPSDLEQTGAQS